MFVYMYIDYVHKSYPHILRRTSAGHRISAPARSAEVPTGAEWSSKKLTQRNGGNRWVYMVYMGLYGFIMVYMVCMGSYAFFLKFPGLYGFSIVEGFIGFIKLALLGVDKIQFQVNSLGGRLAKVI